MASCPTLGLDFALLDDGYQTAFGDWLDWQQDKFPDGIEWLVSECKKAGVAPGLWLAPFVVQEGSQMYLKCIENNLLVANDDGIPISAGKIRKLNIFALDGSHPYVQKWLEEMFSKICSKGIKYIKIDFLYVGALPGSRFDKKLTRAQAFRMGLEAIRRGASDAFLIGCGAPFSSSIGIVNAMRVGPDVATGWKHFDKSSPGAENAIKNVIARAYTHRRLWLNDPDAYILRTSQQRLNSHEILSLNTALALSGGMVSIGDDLMHMISIDTPYIEAQRNMLKTLIPSYGKASAVSRRLFHVDR